VRGAGGEVSAAAGGYGLLELRENAIPASGLAQDVACVTGNPIRGLRRSVGGRRWRPADWDHR
jgi:hypothetical protein